MTKKKSPSPVQETVEAQNMPSQAQMAQPDAQAEDVDELDDEVSESLNPNKQNMSSSLSSVLNTSSIFELRIHDQDQGERLDKVLAKMLPQFSRSRIQQWIEAGLVTIDDQVMTAKMAKSAALGDEKVVVQAQANEESQSFQAENRPLHIVYEDEHILVVNKPCGLVVHPAAGNWSGTLLNALLHHVPSSRHLPRAGIVHRLDKETSGVMVVAKTLEAQTHLVRQLQKRSVKREYLALVWGQPQISGTIEGAIARHHRDRLKMAVSLSQQAKPATTHYQRIGVGQLDKFPVSLMRCKLETGRTHQIRVHMSHLGFALVGDSIYGKTHLQKFFPRQALHAEKLGLHHPATQEWMQWECPLADDLQILLQQCGIDIAQAKATELELNKQQAQREAKIAADDAKREARRLAKTAKRAAESANVMVVYEHGDFAEAFDFSDMDEEDWAE